MSAFEVNFDGLVGPTHNYAGLSFGNVASMSHRALVSNPREAALQGLIKMKSLMEMGFIQGIFAPQERPDMKTLHRLGFSGSDEQILQAALKTAPEIFSACCSASSMWTANAATTSASADSADRKVHFTAANLNNKFHRSIEHPTTSRLLKSMFPDDRSFAHHSAIPSSDSTGDEGAANHTRLCTDYGKIGLHLFVYGRVAVQKAQGPEPKNFPARQSLEASEAIARLHRLPAELCFFAQQNPDMIDGGAFHNDVVAVGNRNVLFHHELAFYDGPATWARLQKAFLAVCGEELIGISVKNSQVPIGDAVKSYLFNSQLLSLPSGGMCLVAPQECQQIPSVRDYLKQLMVTNGPIKDIRYFDLRQSMQNGGGPACLRFRVVLNEEELSRTNQSCLLTIDRYGELTDWVTRNYRDRLTLQDLADPKFLQESRQALDELTKILRLGSVYPFQS